MKKEIFDCSKIGDFYDCGCDEGPKKGGEKKEEKVEEGREKKEEKKEGKEKAEDEGKLVLEKEPRMRGG